MSRIVDPYTISLSDIQELNPELDSESDYTTDPSLVGVPHETWKPEQLDLYTKVRNSNPGTIIFGQVPPGGGKTAVACAMGADEPVLYVAATLSLLDQASKKYGFAVIKGRQEYLCVHPNKVLSWQLKHDQETPTAADCAYAPMKDCQYHSECSYALAKRKALASSRMACTYKYLAVSRNAKKRSGSLVLDECHEAVEQIIEFSSFTLDENRMNWWGMPKVPFDYAYGYKGKGDIATAIALEKIMAWLRICRTAMTEKEIYDADGTVSRVLGEDSKRGTRARRLWLNIGEVIRNLSELDAKWFLKAGPRVIEKRVRERGRWIRKTLAGVEIRPLTAKNAMQKMIAGKGKILLMSATVGNTAEALAGELGLTEYEFYSYDHPVPRAARPVYDLRVPKMTKKNLDKTPALYTVQATAVAGFIKQLPEYWRGVVLTSSYVKIAKMKAVLIHLLPGRIFESPNGVGLTERIKAFTDNTQPGMIAIDSCQGWGHGLDLWGTVARFLVVAGIPFGNPNDPYIRARRKQENGDKYYWYKAYMTVVQASGRVSRTERHVDFGGDIEPVDGLTPEDFTKDGWLINVVAIADGSATSPKAKRHYPTWYKIGVVR